MDRAGNQAPGSSPQEHPQPDPTVFLSMRFNADGPRKKEARQLVEALEAYGVKCYLASPCAGDDIDAHVVRALNQCIVFVAFGTDDYAEDTGNTASTHAEVGYWQNTRAKELGARNIVPINMLRKGERFLHPRALLLFGTNFAYHTWERGAAVPKKIINEIRGALAAAATETPVAAAVAEPSQSPHQRKDSLVHPGLDATPGAAGAAGQAEPATHTPPAARKAAKKCNVKAVQMGNLFMQGATSEFKSRYFVHRGDLLTLYKDEPAKAEAFEETRMYLVLSHQVTIHHPDNIHPEERHRCDPRMLRISLDGAGKASKYDWVLAHKDAKVVARWAKKLQSAVACAKKDHVKAQRVTLRTQKKQKQRAAATRARGAGALSRARSIRFERDTGCQVVLPQGRECATCHQTHTRGVFELPGGTSKVDLDLTSCGGNTVFCCEVCADKTMTPGGANTGGVLTRSSSDCSYDAIMAAATSVTNANASRTPVAPSGAVGMAGEGPVSPAPAAPPMLDGAAAAPGSEAAPASDPQDPQDGRGCTATATSEGVAWACPSCWRFNALDTLQCGACKAVRGAVTDITDSDSDGEDAYVDDGEVFGFGAADQLTIEEKVALLTKNGLVGRADARGALESANGDVDVAAAMLCGSV